MSRCKLQAAVERWTAAWQGRTAARLGTLREAAPRNVLQGSPLGWQGCGDRSFRTDVSTNCGPHFCHTTFKGSKLIRNAHHLAREDATIASFIVVAAH
jgi:hypothetical protein